MFLELKPKGMYLSSEKEKENGFLVYRSTKREARTFDVLVMQSNEQKCLQNCCFFFLSRRVVIVVVVALKAPSQPYDEYVCHLHREIPPPSPGSEYRRNSRLPVRSSAVPGKNDIDDNEE